MPDAPRAGKNDPLIRRDVAPVARIDHRPQLQPTHAPEVAAKHALQPAPASASDAAREKDRRRTILVLAALAALFVLVGTSILLFKPARSAKGKPSTLSERILALIDALRRRRHGDDPSLVAWASKPAEARGASKRVSSLAYLARDGGGAQMPGHDFVPPSAKEPDAGPPAPPATTSRAQARSSAACPRRRTRAPKPGRARAIPTAPRPRTAAARADRPPTTARRGRPPLPRRAARLPRTASAPTPSPPLRRSASRSRSPERPGGR